MLNALFIGVAIFCALEAHDWLRRRREHPEDTKSVGDMIRTMIPQEKAEYMLPMDWGEYEDHMRSETSHGELMKELDKQWTSDHHKSPSSDT